LNIYEYHSNTGEWPFRTDDLALTSLPQQFPYWRQLIEDEVLVVVWHETLNDNPKENAGVMLVYHKKGLYARLGPNWVCWGDLRTGYIKTDDLRARLQASSD
jgi:hypothetical protein